MRSSRVILFDLGGVLVENTGEQGLLSLLPYQLDRREIWARWLASDAVRRFERGQISPEVFAARFIEEWRLEVAPAAFMDAFVAWPRGLFDGAAALVRNLRARHRVACLSNTNALHWARFPELPELFDSSFASHLTGFLKPDPEAFEHVLRELDVRADAVWFFDDLLQNVEAARTAGIRALQVRTFAEVEPALRAEGLYA
ncbi:MAG: HAD family phosphatase [Pseudomonadota bacterium]